METTESKKLFILRILNILEKYSDANHLLTYNDILKLLKKDFNIECERKAVARNICFLEEAGYDIVRDFKKGVYLNDKLFEKSQLRLLIDSVLSSRHINEKHSKELIDKLSNLGGAYFKTSNSIRVNKFNKTHNKQLFLNIEIIEEAIEKEKKVAFIYNDYNFEKKLVPRKNSKYLVNPYNMLLSNQRYYLLGNIDKYDNLIYFKMDRITNIEIVENSFVKPIAETNIDKNGFDIEKLQSENPYMYSGPIKDIEMIANKSIINDIIDWFSEDVTLSELNDNEVTVKLKGNFNSIRYWALQYGNYVQVTKPLELREIIKQDIENMYIKYKK